MPARSVKGRTFERVQQGREAEEEDEEEVVEQATCSDLLLIWCCAEGDQPSRSAHAEDIRCWRTVLLLVAGVAVPLVGGALLYYRPTPLARAHGTVHAPPLSHGVVSPSPPPSPPSPPPPPPCPPPSPASKFHWVNPIDVPDNEAEKVEPPGCNCAFAEGGCSNNDLTFCWQLCCRT